MAGGFALCGSSSVAAGDEQRTYIILAPVMRFALFCINYNLPQACWQQRAKSKVSIRQIATGRLQCWHWHDGEHVTLYLKIAFDSWKVSRCYPADCLPASQENKGHHTGTFTFSGALAHPAVQMIAVSLYGKVNIERSDIKGGTCEGFDIPLSTFRRAGAPLLALLSRQQCF